MITLLFCRVFQNRPGDLGSTGRFKRAMWFDVHNHRARYPGHTSSLIRRRTTTFFLDERLFFFFLLLLPGKRAQNVAERREIPFPFCHTPLFDLFSWGLVLFLLLLLVLATSCVSCALDMYTQTAHVGG